MGRLHGADWVKEINGAPITVTGQNAVDPGSYAPQTIGRFWTADYINAWQTLQSALATKYDGMAIIRGMSQTAGAYATDEPFVPLRTAAAVSTNPLDGTVNQIAQLQMGGYNDAGEMLTLRAAIADYYQWSTTPLDYTMNNFHLFDSGNELPAGISRWPSCSRRGTRAASSRPATTPCGIRSTAPTTSSTASSPTTPC